MNKADILMEQINKLLDGQSTFQDFNRDFWSYYLKNVSSKDLTEEEDDFFSEIQETFDWTAENPTDEERGYGYMDWQQFIEFVKEAKEVFLKKGKLNLKEAERIRLSVRRNNLNER